MGNYVSTLYSSTYNFIGYINASILINMSFVNYAWGIIRLAYVNFLLYSYEC